MLLPMRFPTCCWAPLILALLLLPNVLGQKPSDDDNTYNSPYLISNQTYFMLRYSAMDQCYQRKPGQAVGSFALSIYIPDKRQIGLSKMSILFCYPGTLESSGTRYRYGMSAGATYIVKNEPNNAVALECAKRRRSVTARTANNLEGEGTVWHGIRISEGSNERQYQLEMSFAKKGYKFKLGEGQHLFNIQFGKRYSLFTTLVDQNDNEIEFENHDDVRVRNEYLAKRDKKVVRLSDHVGMWMLGLDMLPMLSRRLMHLHVYRDCSCDWHAWFHNPFEKRVFSSLSIDAYPPMPLECAVLGPTEMAFKFPRSNHANSVLISFRLSNQPHYVHIRLKDKRQKVICFMNITRNQIWMTSSGEHGNEKKNFTANNVLNGNINMNVQFVLRHFFYVIKVNNETYGNYFPWTTDWWNEKQRIKKIRNITLEGDVYPTSVGVKRTKEPIRNAARSIHLQEPAFSGHCITFRGRINHGAKYLEFYLLQNAFEISEHFGTAILALRLNFSNCQSGYMEIKYQEWDEAKKQNELKNYANASKNFDPKNQIKCGDPFELKIHLLTIYATNPGIDDKHQELLEQINVTFVSPNHSVAFTLKEQFLKKHFITDIGLDGDAILFEPPEKSDIKLPNGVNDKKASSVETYEGIEVLAEYRHPFHFIVPMFAKGDSVEINGALQMLVEQEITSLRIYLLYESTDPDDKDIEAPLGIDFLFSANESFYESVMKVHSTSKRICPGKDKCDVAESYSRVFAGSEFKIKIVVDQADQYSIYIYGALALKFKSKLPTWAATVLSVSGSFREKLRINRTIASRQHLAMPYVKQMDNLERIVPNKTIIIRATAVPPNNGRHSSTDAVLFSVTLLNGARAPSEYFGKSVLQMNFTSNALKYRFYDQQNVTKLSHAIKQNEEIILHIKFIGHHRINLLFNNEQLFDETNTTMPGWAVQYIRVEGNLTLNAEVAVNAHDTGRQSAKKMPNGDIWYNWPS